MPNINVCYLAFLACGSIMAAACSKPSSDLRPVTAADVSPSEHDDIRETDPELFLAAFGDFDGDGAQDEARLFANDTANKLVVQVTWGARGDGGARTAVVIAEDPLDNVINAALLSVPPGRNKEICYDNFETCDEDQRRWFTLEHESVALRYFAPGKQIVYGWNGEEFDAYIIVD